MTDAGYEYFYKWVLILGWVIIPTVVNVVFFAFFARASREGLAHQKALDDNKYQIDWGRRWDGTPYIKNEGWGLKYSKLSKDEYFKELYDKNDILLKKQEEGVG